MRTPTRQLFVVWCSTILQWRISSLLPTVNGFEFNSHTTRAAQHSDVHFESPSGVACRITDRRPSYVSSPLLHASRSDEDKNERRPLPRFSSRRAVIVTTAASLLPIIQCTSSPAAAATINNNNNNNNNKPARVKGAAEYDFEYYVQDALKGNKREGTRPASPPPPPLPPRALLDTEYGFITKLLLNDRCDGGCVSVRELAKLLAPSSSDEAAAVVERDISKRVVDLRERASKSFYALHPWTVESVLDQYYFDLTSYCLYRVAADLVPSDYALRDRWVRNVGRCVYKEIVWTGLVRRPVVVAAAGGGGGGMVSLTDTIPTMLGILDLFNTTDYLDTYRFVGDDSTAAAAKSNNNNDAAPPPPFDSYDDEDLQSGTDVNFILSLTRPTTLGASLQITGESSRFTPEWVAPVLMAMWEDEMGGSTGVGGSAVGKRVKAQVEGYFVDGTYRPNPKDFFPDELLLQFTLKQK